MYGWVVHAAHAGGFKKLGLYPEVEMFISANNCAKRYRVYVVHMQTTRLLSCQLLYRLKKYYGMGKQVRLLLEVSATVRVMCSTM